MMFDNHSCRRTAKTRVERTIYFHLQKQKNASNFSFDDSLLEMEKKTIPLNSHPRSLISLIAEVLKRRSRIQMKKIFP